MTNQTKATLGYAFATIMAIVFVLVVSSFMAN